MRAGRPKKTPPPWQDEARELRAGGMTWQALGVHLRVADSTVRYWICDAYRAAKQRPGSGKPREKLSYEERRRRANESRLRTKQRHLERTGMAYDKWLGIRIYCREIAAQQKRPVEEVYREFGVDK